MKQFMDEARKLIRTSSIANTGNEEIANFANGILQDRGFRSDLQMVMHSVENLSKRQFNVIGILGDPLVDRKTRKGLLLLSHLDTAVPGLRQAWTDTGGDPLELTAKDGFFTGLGVASGKLDFLCRVHAAQRFRERKLKMPIYVVGTCGGSFGMFGARYLIQSRALNPSYTLVSEPTALQFVHAQKGCLELRLTIGFQMVERDARGFNRRVRIVSRGRTAHSSDPSQGEHAVLHALALLEEASAAGFDLRFTSIEGGEWPTQVPDRCTLELYTTSHQFEDFKLFFQHYAERTGRVQAFDLETGGLNEAGVIFLPDAVFPCILDVYSAFSQVQAQGSPDTPYSGPSLDGTSINFSMMRQRLGGMDLHFDLRPEPNQDMAQLEAQIQSSVRAVAQKYPALNLTLHRERVIPALSPNSDLIPSTGSLFERSKRAASAAGLNLEAVSISNATEAALFQKAGFEVASFGPGSPFGAMGSPNESVAVAELEQAMAFYDRLIEEVCL